MLPDILKNNDFMKNYRLLGEGASSYIYALPDHKSLVLKHSVQPDDGFRLLASLSSAKRKKIGFREIIEHKNYGDDSFYLLENLFKIDFTAEEESYLEAINQIEDGDVIFMFEEFISDRMNDIKNKIKVLQEILKDEIYTLDINVDNIMQDENGKIYLTDPIC